MLQKRRLVNLKTALQKTKGHCSKGEAPDCAHSRTESAVHPRVLPALLETNKGKILAKKINVHIEDVKHSKSWDGFLKNVWRKKLEAQSQWDCPGSSLLKTPLFYPRGFDSWLGNENRACCPTQSKNIKIIFKNMPADLRSSELVFF